MSRKDIQRKKILLDHELTIQDFANARTSKGRKPRKALVSRTRHISLSKSDAEVDNDSELFDSDQNQKSLKKSKNKINENHNNADHLYNDYHIDIWFLISECIYPEDVGRFALICRKTEAVVASAKFWSSLYHRYYSHKHENYRNLPVKYYPDRMMRLGGLRANVIKTLFCIYRPFTNRIQNECHQSSLSLSCRNLMRLECLNIWCRKEEKNWSFVYKFYNGIKVRDPLRQRLLSMKRTETVVLSDRTFERNTLEETEDFTDDIESFLLKFNNIFENPHEGCYLLIVFSTRYIPLPNFKGQRSHLSSLKQPLSSDLCKFNLNLEFSNYKGECIATVTYDSVIKFLIINWWHPDYSLFLKH